MSLSSAPDAPTAPIPTVRPGYPAWLSAGLVALVLLLVIGLSAYGGYRAGLSERTRNAEAAARRAADEQFDLGRQDLAAGRYERARLRFEYILSIDPGYPGAAAALAEAERRLNATPTPTATPTPLPDTAGELFARAEALATAGDWDGVIQTIGALRGVDPGYEAIKADGLMYRALRNRGVDQIKAGALELGISDLDQAEKIGPLDSEADGYRLWAELYLAANSYWGLNWERASYYFGELYAAAPYFQDTFQKYYQATRNYGDQLARAGEACGAEQQYELALRLKADPDLTDLLAAAREACAAATPTPDPNATPTSDPNATPTPEPTALPNP
ncbi:MAG: hypothetical protein HY784_16665 [Chloroflexi bacterium]|nr:hypothetical protein [Chloroflexota bacterium]